jgi:hypothetical protein
LIEVINEAVCISKGVVHHFSVQWAAAERRRLYLVAVEVLPEHDEPKTIYLMCRASTSRRALVKLLNDGLETSSREVVAHGS